jgi:hypothetical protein
MRDRDCYPKGFSDASNFVIPALIVVSLSGAAFATPSQTKPTSGLQYYREKGEVVDVAVVTYGPGLHMLRADTSPARDRIKALKDLAFPSKIQFSACNNTREGMEKKEGHAIGPNHRG